MLTGLAKYGAVTPQMTGEAVTMHGNAIVTPTGTSGRLDPDSPVLWLFGIGAVTLGLVAFSTHVRVGPVSASLGAGK